MQCTLVSCQKICFGCQIWIFGKFTFEGLPIVIIQKFKFQKMCIKVHNGSNNNNTSFELLDWENGQYQPK
jgi:hypothetical protein